MQWSDRVGRRLKLRDLHILLAVMHTGSMTKAASLMSVSHPIVSKAVADLERTLGVRLFDRSSRGIEPTRFGQALSKRSISLFDDLKQAVKEIEFLADPTVGELSIGASEPVAAGLLPAAIKRLTDKHPRIRFNVEQGDALTLQRRELRDRKVDLVIARMLSAPQEPGRDAEVLFYEKLMVVAGVRSKWASRRKIALKELVNEPWILAPLETLQDSPFTEAFHAMGLEPPIAKVLVYSLPLRLHLLGTGEYLSLVPGSVLHFSGEHMALKALPVQLPEWRLPVAIVTLKGRKLSPVAQTLIESVRQVTRTIADKGQRFAKG
jgi:DNA-binding transcriptional LysR family regulator